MKRSFIKISLYFLSTVFILSACLNGDPINTPPGGQGHVLAMAYNPAALANGGTALLSGMRYFGNGALTYPSSHAADTATLAVTLQGGAPIGKDVTVTLVADPNALLDNYATDSITYLTMPDSIFSLSSTTAVIKAGSATAEFKVYFKPNKVNVKKSFMLALTATNDANIPMSSNYGHLYLHFIGNAIQGSYSYDYMRYNNCTTMGDCAGSYSLNGSSFGQWAGTSVNTTFSPLNAKSISVPATYFNGPVYKIAFDDDGVTLSNFKVSFFNLDASLTAAGITVAGGPVISYHQSDVTVNGVTYTWSSGHDIFVISFTAWNGAAFRGITDVYQKQ